MRRNIVKRRRADARSSGAEAWTRALILSMNRREANSTCGVIGYSSESPSRRAERVRRDGSSTRMGDLRLPESRRSLLLPGKGTDPLLPGRERVETGETGGEIDSLKARIGAESHRSAAIGSTNHASGRSVDEAVPQDRSSSEPLR